MTRAGWEPRGTPGEGLRDLLTVARAQVPAQATAAVLERAVAAMVPDEALILERLAQLVHVPLVHIWTRPHTGAPGEPVLENASRIGRLAGVALPDLTCTYVGHLLGLGLVRTQAAGEHLGDYFQALLAEPMVLRALARANADGSTPRVVREALSLSPLGEDLVGQLESSTDEP